MVALNKPVAGDTDWTAEINDNWTTIENSLDQALCEGRLTLESGAAIYVPQAKPPFSTSIASDTVDFASAHGWSTGTMVTPSATGGGLTAGTAYFINAIDSDTVSFHNNITDALSGSGKVDLTAPIAGEIRPLGKALKTLYFTPYKGDRIALYNGSTWIIRTFSEISLSLTLTTGKNYDLFVYDNSGTAALELSAAWTNDTTRADALATQNGILVKSGAAARRYVGTIRAYEANAVQDSAQKRFVINYYNRTERSFWVVEYTDSWTYSTASWRSWNDSSANRVEFISLGENPAFLLFSAGIQRTNVNVVGSTGIGLDSTTAPAGQSIFTGGNVHSAAYNAYQIPTYVGTSSPGYHYLQLLEYGGTNLSFFGDAGGPTYWLSGAVGWVMG